MTRMRSLMARTSGRSEEIMMMAMPSAASSLMMKEGFLKMEQAVVALTHCQKNQLSFDDALDELGWTMPTRVTMPGDDSR